MPCLYVLLQAGKTQNKLDRFGFVGFLFFCVGFFFWLVVLFVYFYQISRS